MRKNYPGMTIEKLPSGRTRVRVRVEGNPNKKIKINVPVDHPKFSEHYWNARMGKQLPPEAVPQVVKYTLFWLVDGYLKHLEHMVDNELAAAATLRQRRSLLKRLCEHRAISGDLYGDKTIHAPTAAFIQVRDDRAGTPAEADNMMKAARAMYKWAMERGYVSQNPVSAVKKIHHDKGGAVSWSFADLEKFKSRHPIGTKAHLALTLLMFTAARSSDVYRIGTEHELTMGGGERWLGWQPVKRGAKFVKIPIMPQLQRAIEAANVRAEGPYLLNQNGSPFKSADCYRNWFRDRCDEAGLKNRSSHGVRKAVAELLAESNCSEHQIMAVLSHTQPNTSAIYTRGAERQILAGEAMANLDDVRW